jgi:hypothetical protein
MCLQRSLAHHNEQQQPVTSPQEGGSIDLIELPRLRLTFSRRTTITHNSGTTTSQLYSHEVCLFVITVHDWQQDACVQ